jgi:hypothetical protein
MEQEKLLLETKMICATLGLDAALKALKKCPFCASTVNILIEGKGGRFEKDPPDSPERVLVFFGFKCMNQTCFFFVPPIYEQTHFLDLVKRFNTRKSSNLILLPNEVPKIPKN